MKQSRPRINQQIRAPEVRVVGSDGKQIGTMSSLEALNLAKEKGLDLVEVASKARPPVVRILDFKKYEFAKKRQQQESKKKTKVSEVKELRFGPNIGPNDLQIRIERAKEFLGEGNKVKITIQFKGRQITHPEIGFDKIKKMIQTLSEISEVEQETKKEGRFLYTILKPK